MTLIIITLGIDTTFHNWTNSFRGCFGNNFSDVDDIQYKTIAITCCNNYFPPQDLNTPIFKEAPNCNNHLSFGNLQSPGPEY